MGSIATGIPIGAPVAPSPFKTSASFCAWSCEDDAKNVDRYGKVIGRLQVRWMVLFPFLFFHFFPFSLKSCFCVFSLVGRRIMLGTWCRQGSDGKEV